MGYFQNVARGARSLITGLRITLRELFRKPVTLTYPHKKPELSKAYRSAIKLIRFDDTNSHDCVACLACQRICPSFCIDITGGRVEGIKKKRAATFEMDFALCSLCGLCIDACPTDTLEYSKIYDEAGFQRDWNFDLLEEFRTYETQFVEEQKQRELAEAEKKQAKAAAAKAAKAKAAEAKAKAAEAKAAEAKATTPTEPASNTPEPAVEPPPDGKATS